VEIDADDAIRCAVPTVPGGSFCTGMDLQAMGGPEAEKYQHRMVEDQDLHWKGLLRHSQPKKPLIAAVEGWAVERWPVAGGTEILQVTDIRVVGEGAKFGVFEARRGWFLVGGSTCWLLSPHPRVSESEDSEVREPVTSAGATEVGGVAKVTALPEYRGRDPSRRPRGQREVAG
jgi:enoyl-CoA hydratase